MFMSQFDIIQQKFQLPFVSANSWNSRQISKIEKVSLVREKLRGIAVLNI